MVTNNEAVDNFLNGRRNLAVYQFSQLIKETANSISSNPTTDSTPPLISSSTKDASNKQPNSDEIAFNYAMINLFTGCPKRASIIFSDLVKRYPRNPRLWLRLAESMLASERAKMNEFEHIQQLTYQHSRDHLIKAKNKPILIKINPNYCQQQIQQQFQLQKETPSNFLVSIKGYLQKALELINEYNDISLLTDDIPQQQHLTSTGTTNSNNNASTTNNFSPSIASTSSPSLNTNNSSMITASESSIIDTTTLASESNNANINSTQVPKLSSLLSYANPYQSISRSDLYHLRNKVQLNLAYICLCMGEPVKALNYTTQCLKASPLGYEKVLASLYHAEACILACRVDEAIQFLNLEVLNMAKSLSQSHPAVTGDTSKRVAYGEEMHRQLESGALTTIVTYNLSVAYAAKGEFSNAYKIVKGSVQPMKPNPMQIIICLLYIQLQQGQIEMAKRTILNNLPQFR